MIQTVAVGKPDNCIHVCKIEIQMNNGDIGIRTDLIRRVG